MPINTENPIQIIRGDKASISARTGKDGEPNWATDTHELFIHDGVTPGGHKVGGQGAATVPIYEGATDSSPGVPGLVPSATSAEKDMYLKGDGTYGNGLSSSDFESPTAEAPGKSGLVPQPQATDPSLQLSNILTMLGWGNMSPAFVAKDPTSADSKQLCPAIVFANELDANALATGFFQSAKWTNAPSATSGTLLAFQMPIPQGYSVIQIFFSYTGHSSYRTTIGTVAYGQTPENATWEDWITIGAPRPKSAAGVGQVQAVENSANFVNLPDGGVWFYHLWGHLKYDRGTLINGQALGIAGGGTPIYVTPSNGQTPDVVSGWAWCIA